MRRLLLALLLTGCHSTAPVVLDEIPAGSSNALFGAEAIGVCSAPVVLRAGSCPAGSDCSTKGSTLTWAELDAWGQNVAELCLDSVGGGGGGSGDVTDVGDCATGACFQSVAQRSVFAGPTGGSGVASFRALDTADIASGTLADARVAASNVTQHQGAITITESQVSDLSHFTPNADPGVDHASYVAGHGDGTNCDAGQWAAGTDGSGNAQGCTVDDDSPDDDSEVPDALTISGGSISSSTIVLDTGANPTVDGQIRWNTTTERLEIGDDGVATLELYPGPHNVDTGPAPDCFGTLTYQDGEGGCDAYTLHGDTTDLATASGATPSGQCAQWDASGNLVASGGACGGGAPAFSSLTSGTNTAAAMVVGSGASLSASGTGTIRSTGMDSDRDGNLEVSADGTSVLFAPSASFPGTATWAVQLDRIIPQGQSGGAMWRRSPSATVPTLTPNSNPGTTGLGQTTTTDMRLIVSSTSIMGLTDTAIVAYARHQDDPQSATCASSGDASPGSVVITPNRAYVQITNNDPEGCDVTLSETGAVAGQRVELTVTSNAGGTVNFGDLATVQEMGTGCNLPLYGTAAVRYTGASRWVRRFCETNV